MSGTQPAGLENLSHHILRAAEADALVGFDDRPVDEDRVRDHCVQDLVVSDIEPGEAELLGERLLGSQPVARSQSSALVQPLQLFAARRRLHIFVDRHVRARLGEDIERFAGRPAHWIVINCCFHRA